jgi:uncharacterized delta-60 repeat protein
MSQQQTVLRVRTNRPSTVSVTGTTGLDVFETSGVASGYTGTGTLLDPYVGSFGTSGGYIAVRPECNGTIYWNCRLYDTTISNLNFFAINKKHPEDAFTSNVFNSFSQFNVDYSKISTGDEIYFRQAGGATSGGTFSIYFQPDIQEVDYTIPSYDFLDLYDDIPITINKSFAEIEDISKRNSDYSLGVKLPGSKRNNRFFEDFFNVDSIGLYFDPLKKVPCNVLIDDESYFTGFMKLNSVSVKDSKIEYDVTLFSSVGDLYGKIGTKLLKDLDFRDIDYFMNHYFTRDNVLSKWRYETLKDQREVPSDYFYPVVHNGYNYNQSGSFNNVAFTGTTGTSLYTTTITGSWVDTTAAYAAGADRYRINSPVDGIRDNQLKPSMNVYSLIQMIFKQNGYEMGGSFKKIPWFKLLYMYGYFSDDNVKLSYTTQPPQTYGLDEVELRWVLTTSGSTRTWNAYVVKLNTGTPCFCSDTITGILTLYDPGPGGGFDDYRFSIAPATTGYTRNWGVSQFYSSSSANVPISSQPMSFLPGQVNQIVGITEGGYVDFGQVIDNQIKQIDILSSVAKKFNLLFIPDENNPFQINVEPYDYYVGTGNVYDWTDRLSYDKGFTVQPAQNFVESEIILSDLEDGDQGNKDYKDSNGLVYGFLRQTNPTDFKSQQKKIETTFSPEVIRVWNPLNNPEYPAGAVKIPLGINYAESSQEVGTAVDWLYKGVKTKPKLFFNLGNFNPFLATGTTIGLTGVTTNFFKVTEASGLNASGSLISPVISHTMPMGNPDTNKITNDSICVLFQSTNVTSNPNEAIGTYNTYTDNDMYNLFYDNRITNIFNKETRFVDGFFNLSLSDIKNLKPNDLIKINNQYFTWNSIVDFNLTNSELTKVQLLQYNTQYKTYPERYFQYYYCDRPTYVYQFKTNFDAENIYDSLYYWSILYDYFVGALGGTVSGYTSSIQFGSGGSAPYIPFYINEISEETYNTSGNIDWNFDPQRYFFLAQPESQPSTTIYNQQNDVFLINSGQTQARLNVFTNCSGFTSAATSLGVITSGSTIPTGITCFNYYTHFQGSSNTPGTIREITINDDYSTYVGGSFRRYNGITYGGITGGTGPNMIKLNYNGSVDTSFTNYGFGQTGTISAIKKQSTGKVIVGGTFTSYSGVTRTGILRLNTDGTLDTTFNAISITGVTGAFGAAELEILSDDSIIVVGNFSLGNGTGTTSITKLNSNGTQSTGFTRNLVNSGSTIYDVEVYDGQLNGVFDGRIIVCGTFTTWGGVSRNNIARLFSDGTLDTNFVVGTGFTSGSTVSNVEIQPDGKIIVGGNFTSYNGTTGLQGICRLNFDGTIDTTFQTSFTGGTVFNNYRPKLLPTGQILTILSRTGLPTNFIRLNGDGSIDPTFNTGVVESFNISSEDATAVQDDGTIYFGFTGQIYNGRDMWSIVKLTPDGYFVDCPEEPPVPVPNETPAPFYNLDNYSVNVSISKTPYYDITIPDTSRVLIFNDGTGESYNITNRIDGLYRYTFNRTNNISIFATVTLLSGSPGARRATINLYQTYYTQNEENGDRGIVRELIQTAGPIPTLAFPQYGPSVFISNKSLPDFVPPGPINPRAFVYNIEYEVEVIFFSV